MLKYAEVTDEKTKRCSVGLGVDEEYYKKIGYKQMEVEEGYDGSWYLKEYVPVQSLAELKQIKLEELKKNNEDYILSIYPEYKQRNIGIFGTEEERNAFKTFKENQTAWYYAKIVELGECKTEETLSEIGLELMAE
jgi:hypothetical protein